MEKKPLRHDTSIIEGETEINYAKMMSVMADAGFGMLGTQTGLISNAYATDLATTYYIGSYNKMAGAYIDKISAMVGREGFEVVDDNGEVMQNRAAKTIIENCKNFFRSGVGDAKTFMSFRQQFFYQVFCSGEVAVIPSEINAFGRTSNNGYAKVLDTRRMQKMCDKYGEITQYFHYTPYGMEEFTPQTVANIIYYKNPNDDMCGLSLFVRIATEALTNIEANGRQLMFFRNKAMPNILIKLTKNATEKNLNQFISMWNSKFKGIGNEGKPLVSDIVDSIEKLSISNVELDYINLRKENDKDFSIIFLLDARLVGLQKESGSYNEVEVTTIRQGNDQINTYGMMMSEAINIMYKKFIDPNIEGTIRLKNAQFKDINKDKEIALKEKAEGVINGNEYRNMFGYEMIEGVESLDQYAKSEQKSNNVAISQ